MKQKAKIYQPTKTAMQSGKARTKFWILEFNKSNSNKDFVMGWTSSSNTDEQIKLNILLMCDFLIHLKHDIDELRSSEN